MNKKELTERVQKWIEWQDESKDDWYCSDKGAAIYILGQFLKDEFNIDLPEYKETQ